MTSNPLPALNISLGVLFGQSRIDSIPSLVAVLPPHLQHLTINDDLWGFDAFKWTGPGVLAVLRTFLDGGRRLDGEWNKECWQGEDVPWESGATSNWEFATPELQEFVLDIRENVSGYPYWELAATKEVVRQACDSQGLRCSILQGEEEGA